MRIIIILLLASLACSRSAVVLTATHSPRAHEVPRASSTVPAVRWAETRRVCSDALNIRSAPVYSALVVGSLLRGDLITVFDRTGGWVRVGVGQWVRDAYLC